MEIIYYDNRYMSNGGFSEANNIAQIADIIKNAFNFDTVSFEGNYDKSRIGENGINFQSDAGNKMTITLTSEDSHCDAIKFKNKEGSVTHIVYKDDSNTFILRPTGGGQDSAGITCYFDEVGLGIDGRKAYQSNNRAFLKDTFNFKVLEDKKNEANNTMITYSEDNNNYSYSPLYYINGKQMTAIQNNYPPSTTKEFVWDLSYKFRKDDGNTYSTKEVEKFNFANNGELWLYDGFNTADDPAFLKVYYNKEEQRLSVLSLTDGGDKTTRQLDNIDMNDYELFYLQRGLFFTLAWGVHTHQQNVEASKDLTASCLFNDDFSSSDLTIHGNCVLKETKLDFDNTKTYVCDEAIIGCKYPSTDWAPVEFYWQDISATYFTTMYHEKVLNYKQKLALNSQTYDNARDGKVWVPYGVMASINRKYKQSNQNYVWEQSFNPIRNINFTIQITDFVSSTAPTLTKASIIQDNYCLAPDNQNVRLSNIQVFITTPGVLKLPRYFSLLEGHTAFSNIKDIQTTSSGKNTKLSEVLANNHKDWFWWCHYQTHYYTLHRTNFYSNITFAATSFASRQQLINHAKGDTPPSDRTYSYSLILKKKEK